MPDVRLCPGCRKTPLSAYMLRLAPVRTSSGAIRFHQDS